MITNRRDSFAVPIIMALIFLLLGVMAFIHSRETMLNGEVFIIGNEGQSIKLGLVPVSLIPANDFMLYINDRVLRASNEMQRIQGELAGLKENDEARWKLEFEEVEFISPNFYFQSLPSPTISTKTDSDGRFLIKVPRNESYVLVAATDPEINGLQKRYFWAIPVKDENKITLSTDNLFEPKVGRWPW